MHQAQKALYRDRDSRIMGAHARAGYRYFWSASLSGERPCLWSASLSGERPRLWSVSLIRRAPPRGRKPRAPGLFRSPRTRTKGRRSSSLCTANGRRTARIGSTSSSPPAYFDDSAFPRRQGPVGAVWNQSRSSGVHAVARFGPSLTIPEDVEHARTRRLRVCRCPTAGRRRSTSACAKLYQDTRDSCRSGKSLKAWTSPARSTASMARRPAAASAPASNRRCSTAATHTSTVSSRGSIASTT